MRNKLNWWLYIEGSIRELGLQQNKEKDSKDKRKTKVVEKKGKRGKERTT